MKTLNKALIALSVSGLLAMSANANTAMGETYLGVKVGQFDVENDKAGGKADKPVAYGIYGGVNFDQNFGVEAEYQGSNDADITVNGVKGEHNSKTYGLYGTYRYHFANTPVYAKAKLGVAKTQDEADVAGAKSKVSDTSVAGGVGLGFKATPNFGIEAGYNYLNKDANVWGVGAHLSF